MSYSAKKIFACLMVAGVVVALAVWLLILPIIEAVEQASEGYRENQRIIQGLDQQIILSQQLKKNYLKKESQFRSIEQAFLPESETVGFITTLEQIARQTGNDFEIKTANTVVDQNNQDQAFLSLHILLQGDFNSLLEFLANLEDSPYPPYRLTQIDRISVQRIGERGISSQEVLVGPNDLETVLGIKIYLER